MSFARNPALVRRAPLTIAVVAALLAAPAAYAIDFKNGELEGSFDTTLSYGASMRMQKQDQNLIGKATINPLIGAPAGFPGAQPAVPSAPFTALGRFPGSPGQTAAPGRYSVNRDDGNLKYNDGDLISSAIKITSELSLKWRGWGAFTRATWFHDFENAGRQDLTQVARDRIGDRFRILDGFIYKDFTYGDGKTASVRLGRQVVSWGESTFISNGINVINPVDLSALRVAGAELKEAFLPIDALWGSFQVTDNLSVEGVVLGEFEEVEIDPAGTYFSANDFASPGGTYAMLGFGTTPQPVDNPELYYQVCNGSAAGWSQSDRLAGYIATLRAAQPTAPNAVIQAQALGLVNAGCSSTFQRGPNKNAKDTGQWGLAAHWLVPALADTEFGFYYLRYHSRLPVISGYAANLPGPGGGRPVPGASVVIEYPEDIDLYGLSWNTNLPWGVAFQGEVSYRPNMPLQFDDVELLFAGLSPLNPVIPVGSADFISQLGQYTGGQYIQGWDRYHVTQLQSTFTKVFGEVLGTDQISLVAEIGGTKVNDMPDPSVRRFEGEGTDTGGGCSLTDVGTFSGARNPDGSWVLTLPPTPAGAFNPNGCLRNPQTSGGFPTDFSWGYRLAARADYNSVFGGPINLSPRIAFNHDVHGTTPGPGGNFLEGRKSFTVGIEANYLQQWVFDLSLTRFSGAHGYNQIADRDFASASIKYSF